MKAIIKTTAQNARNYSGEKELTYRYAVIGKINGELRTVVDARCWRGRRRNSSTVYASVWVNGLVHTSGRGQAGGYGYHKASAAIGSALSDAGIELYGDVYESYHHWNYEEKQENTPKEIAAIKRRLEKRRAYIGGVGESAIRAALMAVAKAAGAKGKLIIVD